MDPYERRRNLKKENTKAKINTGARPKTPKQEYTEEHSEYHGTTLYPEFSTSDFSYEINQGIEACKSKLDIFKRKYLIWNLDRKSTIAELKELVDKVHDEQLNFNSANLFFKQLNSGSRRIRTETVPESSIDTIASISTFITDAISGITSVVQACNVDLRMKKFGEIMERDAENTKPLYDARSNCFDNYRNVEEIIRRYHSETFGTTWNKITRAIETESMWLELKDSKHDNDFSKVFEKVDVIVQQLSKIETLNEIRGSIGNYVDNNPAVLEACESSGKALFGAYDMCTRNSKKRDNAVSRSINNAANSALILRTDSEVNRLQRLVSNAEEPQAKLESKIREALYDLEKEAFEMQMLYESCDSFNTLSQSNFDYHANCEFD